MVATRSAAMLTSHQTADNPAVATTLKRCRTILEEHYGRRLAGLVLFGSTARGKASKESDLDLLALLRGDFAELRRVTPLLYPAQLDSDRLISARPAPVADFEAGALQLYRNAAREGVAA